MWLVLSFLTAFFTSLTDVCNKKILRKVDVYIVAWSWLFFSLPFLFCMLPFKEIPQIKPPFVGALIVSTFIITFGAILMIKALKLSDLSLCMPMLSFTPLFLLVTSPLILGEMPGPFGIVGILLIVFGSYVLNFQFREKGFLEPFKLLIKDRGPRYMLMVALMFSVGGNVDKIGVRSSSGYFWILCLNTAVSAFLGIFVIFKVKSFWAQIRSIWPYLILIGLFTTLAVLAQMTAIQLTIVPYVIAIKRTSVIMSSLFGFWLFKERNLKERLTGVVLMVLGVIIISLMS